MPRFFFNVYDDVFATDEEGLVLPNLDAARLQALAGARAIMADQVTHGYLVRSHWIDILDEAGAIVLHLPFRDAIELKDL
jgi:hypothetical protein